MRRVFYAIELSPESKKQIFEYTKTIQYDAKNKIKVENYHMTLVFIGEVSNEMVKKLQKIISDDLTFSLELFELGFFGQAPEQILYIKVNTDNALLEFQRCLVKKLEENGLFLSRSFTPHITIARKANSHSLTSTHFPKMVIEGRVTLMETIQGDGGVFYRSLIKEKIC